MRSSTTIGYDELDPTQEPLDLIADLLDLPIEGEEQPGVLAWRCVEALRARLREADGDAVAAALYRQGRRAAEREATT